MKDDVVSPKVLEQFITRILEFLKNQKAEFSKLSAENLKTIKDSIAYIENVNDKAMNDINGKKNAMAGQFEGRIKEIKALIAKVKTIKPKDGIDGISPNPKDIVPLVLEKMPKIEPFILKRLEVVQEINTGKKKDLKIELEQIESMDKFEKGILDRALGILDQRTQFLINKTVKHDSTLSGAGTDANPLSVVGGGGGTGTVTSVSVVTANGFAGTVANATTTPAITLTTTVNGIIRGNGNTMAAITIGTGLTFSAGTLSLTSGVGAGATLAIVGANSTTTPNSLYTMSAGIPVEFRSSDGNTLLYLDETNERVGIGTAAPGAKLDLGSQAPGINTPANHLVMYGANTSWPVSIDSIYSATFVDHYLTLNGRMTGGTYAAPTFTGGNNGGWFLKSQNSAIPLFQIGYVAAGAGAAPLYRLTIDYAGSLGINTVAPATLLDIVGTGKTAITAQIKIADTVASIGTVALNIIGAQAGGNAAYVLLQATHSGLQSFQLSTSYNSTLASLMFRFHGSATYNTNAGINLSGATNDVGIGIDPVNKLDVSGGLALGSYAGVNVAGTGTLILPARLGIGTVSPACKLDVNGVIDTTSYIVSRLSGLVSGYGAFEQYTDGATYNFSIGTVPTSGDFTFYSGRFPATAGTERMRITQAGLVGIGSAAPTSLLHLESTLNPIANTGLRSNYNLMVRNSGGVNGESTGIAFQNIGTAGDNIGAAIIFKRTGAASQGELQFYTKQSPTGAVAPTLVMTLSDAGNVIVTAPFRLKGYTVGTLPAGTVGDTAYVTDQLTAVAAKGAAPTGGGAVTCVVFYNGTAWVGI